MPSYIVTCKSDASDAEVAAAKKHATEQGGKIEHEYSLIKGFSVSFPKDAISTLSQHPSVQSVEADQEDITSSLRQSTYSETKDSEHLDFQKSPLPPSSTAVDDLLRDLKIGDSDLDRVVHVVVIPNYKEEIETLRETLDVLASHPRARCSYDIYLAMEQREMDAVAKAHLLVIEFVEKFRFIDFVLHPVGLVGDCPGKGSNVNWAARKLSKRYSIACRQDVIVTGIDADSHLSANYFALLTEMHMAYPETAPTTFYAAPIIFDRNAHKIPALVRVADVFWCAAGLSGLYKGSTVAPPTSVYSLPLQLVDRVGGWDCGPEAIGEDLHMYIKCFFTLNGNLTVRTILSPVSQCNVTAGGYGKGATGFRMDLNARYKQAIRHMWGSLDTGFALQKGIDVWQGRNRTVQIFVPLHSQNGAASSKPLDALEKTIEVNGTTRGVFQRPNYKRIFYMFHRIFEAHFLPLQMLILTGASSIYMAKTEGAVDVQGVRWIFELCARIRGIGLLEVLFFLFLYENYHYLAVTLREKEMHDAGLAGGMNFSHRNLKKNFVDYLILPMVAPLFGAIPGAQAQICHFWTTDLVYTVSQKVTRQRTKSAV